MCLNTPSKPKTRISTNPAGLADFSPYPLHCRLLQSSSTHPPFPLHTTHVPWNTARLPTSGGCSHANMPPRTPRVTAGAQHWQRMQPAHVSHQALPSSSTAWAHTLQGYWSPCPKWSGVGQEQCPGQGRKMWVSCLQRWEPSYACTTRVGVGCTGCSCAMGGRLAGTGSGGTCRRASTFGQRGL